MRVEEQENHQLSNSALDMSSAPSSSSNIMPTANNVQMDVDSDLEAQKVALELAQAQEWVHTTNEAQERCREEQKRREEEEEEAQ